MFLKDRALESFYACRGVIEIFDRKFFVSGYRKTSWGNSFVFSKICGSETSLKRKGLSRFFVNNFLSHMPSDFVCEQFCVLENVWYEKKLVTGGGCHVCPSEFFLSHNAENYWEPPYNVSENWGYRKNLCIIVWYHDFPWKFFSLRVP